MTGYAYHETAAADMTVSVEIKGYNSRFLDLGIYLPSWLSSLEPGIREYISSRFGRGKVELTIRIKEHNGVLKVSVNTAAALAYYRAIEDLARNINVQEKPGLDLILGLEGVLETEKNRDSEKYREIIDPVLIAAADKFENERIREGRSTQEDIFLHLKTLEDSVRTISTYAPELEVSIKENLRKRFEEVLGNMVDENRVLSETAVLLMKYTISEEISRLSSHLGEFRSEAIANPVPGKKLDFLCQEINREVNTIGSKSPIPAVSRAVVEMKNALENIREQLRNVE